MGEKTGVRAPDNAPMYAPNSIAAPTAISGLAPILREVTPAHLIEKPHPQATSHSSLLQLQGIQLLWKEEGDEPGGGLPDTRILFFLLSFQEIPTSFSRGMGPP